MTMRAHLRELIDQARKRPMSPAQLEAQIRSFPYGNLALEMPSVTRELIDRVADEQLGRR